jgi:hypothetical protein
MKIGSLRLIVGARHQRLTAGMVGPPTAACRMAMRRRIKARMMRSPSSASAMISRSGGMMSACTGSRAIASTRAGRPDSGENPNPEPVLQSRLKVVRIKAIE